MDDNPLCQMPEVLVAVDTWVVHVADVCQELIAKQSFARFVGCIQHREVTSCQACVIMPMFKVPHKKPT